MAVIGLGYVGLPLAVALADHGCVVGFDVDRSRVCEIQRGDDRTGELDRAVLTASRLRVSHDVRCLAGVDTFIVTVPTPVDVAKIPDLGALRRASAMIGPLLRSGSLVVYESTVYPGATEEVCLPILEETSGLRLGDFHLGYSPERINPGDTEHTLATTIKVISASSREALDRLSVLYGAVCHAGVHRAPSIKVAEAAKVIENTQRDINIALVNELSVIFERLGVSTNDVLDAAATKWNFLPFRPGLVGGHCIGVDPYYLTHKAQTVGYHPQVILAGRRVNDGMGEFVASKTLQLLAQRGKGFGARVGVLGLTFKENVPDFRNSRVPDIVEHLQRYGAQVVATDPYLDAAAAGSVAGQIAFDPQHPALQSLDAIVLAVPHREFLDPALIAGMLCGDGVLVDVKHTFGPDQPELERFVYWAL